MKLDELTAAKIKAIYSDWQISAMSAEEALYELELLINEGANDA